MTRRWKTRLAGSALLVAMPGAAMAAANQCNLPALTPSPRLQGSSERERSIVLKSSVYVLAVSWVPQYCASGEGMGGDFDRSFECDTKANRFGFALHGLWPDGDGLKWPQYCRPAKLLRPAVIRANLCLTPSADLLQHEWAKHGTCAWRTPERYFADARAAYEKLRLPEADPLIARDRLTVGDLVTAFTIANPAIPRDAIRVALNREGWLQEVRFCLNARRRYITCPGKDDPADHAVRIRPIG